MDFKIDFIRTFRTSSSEVYTITLVGDKGEVHVGTLHLHIREDDKNIFLYLGSEYIDHFLSEEDEFKVQLLAKIYEIAEGNKGFSEFTIEFLDYSINPIMFTWDESQKNDENGNFYDFGLVEGE